MLRQYSRNLAWTFRSNDPGHISQRTTHDVPIEKDKSVQCLILSRRRNLEIHGQMRKKDGDLCFPIVSG